MVRHAALLLSAALFLSACQAGETNGDTTAEAPGAAQAPSATGAPAAEAAMGPQPPPAVTTEGITVTGNGRVTGEPDTLRATVGVHVVRPDADQAFDDAAVAAERVLDAVRERGVTDEDIQTREFSIQPQHEHREGEPPRIAGYAVRNLVEVTIRDVDAAGELLGAVAGAAGDDARVEGLHFALEDNDAQLEAARQAAFEDARAKAEHYASLTGGELGELVALTESGAHLPPAVTFGAEAAAADGAAPIMRGEQEVGVAVQATWALR